MINEQRSTGAFLRGRPLLFYSLIFEIAHCLAGNTVKYGVLTKDLATKQVLTWEISAHPNLRFALTPLQKLIHQLPQTGYQITLHTDQGWHYQHRVWRKLLRKGRIRQSMSHRATCLDNATCETVFSKLKAEIGTDTSYHNQDKLIQAIEEWLHFYNERRIQTKLVNQTPYQYEQCLVA